MRAVASATDRRKTAMKRFLQITGISNEYNNIIDHRTNSRYGLGQSKNQHSKDHQSAKEEYLTLCLHYYNPFMNMKRYKHQ